MAAFNITLIEPKGYPFTHFLFDMARGFCYAIESLGHDCSIQRNRFESRRVNIIIGGHHYRNPAEVDELRASRLRYVVIQSEIVRNGEINDQDARGRLSRVYLPLLRGAERVWEAVPENVPELAALDVKVDTFLTGYHPAMQEVVHKNRKDIDFLFYGSVTPHRSELLRALEARGHRLVVLFDDPAIYRNDFIARTKVHLAPAQGGGMDHFPAGRIAYLVNNGCLVAAERCAGQEWLEDCFLHSKAAEWVELCEHTLRRPDREELARVHHERFRERPMTEILEPLLVGL